MSDSENLVHLLPLQPENVGFVGSVVGGAHLLLAIPAWLCHLYLEYLWNWDRHPWVASVAASLRLFAIFTIAPFALLTLLDVGAYVIARTLGVVETTKASTSDSKDPGGVYSENSETDNTTHVESPSEIQSPPVRIDIEHSASPDAEAPPSALSLEARRVADTAAAAATSTLSSSSGSSTVSAGSTASRSKSRFDTDELAIPIPRVPYSQFRGGDEQESTEAGACFFSPSDERQLELSGALLSSPAPSRQASPKPGWRQRGQPQSQSQLQSLTMTMDYQLQTHEPYEREPTNSGTGSTVSSAADSSSFTFLEHSDLTKEAPEGSVGSVSDNSIVSLRKKGVVYRDDDDGPA